MLLSLLLAAGEILSDLTQEETLHYISPYEDVKLNILRNSLSTNKLDHNWSLQAFPIIVWLMVFNSLVIFCYCFLNHRSIYTLMIMKPQFLGDTWNPTYFCLFASELISEIGTSN